MSVTNIAATDLAEDVAQEAREAGTGGALWIMLSKLVSQTSQLVIFVIAARVLTPTEFGYFAVGSAIAILLVLLAEAGWAEYIMKTGDRADTIGEVNSAATLSGFGFTLAAVIGIAVAWGGGASRIQLELLAFFAVWILPAALTTVYDGHLTYRRKFRLQAQLRMISELAGLAVALIGLWEGWGIIALVVARSASLIIYLALCAFATQLRPGFRFRLTHAAEMLQFSKHILQGRLITFLRSYAATLSIGLFLGVAEAGLFRAAERIVAAFAELLGEPARMLGWGAFRRAAQAPDEHGATLELRLSNAGAAYIPMVLAISVPIYLGIPLVSDRFVSLVLGEAWQPAALIVSILAIKQLLLAPAYVSEPLLSVAGNIRRMPPVSLFNAVVAVVAVIVTAPFGYVMVAVGQVVAAAIAFGTTVALQQKYGFQDWISILKHSGRISIAILAGLTAVWLAGLLASTQWQSSIVVLGVQTICAFVVYGLVLRILQPEILHEAWRLAR